MNKLLLVAAMIMTTMALNLKNVATQKTEDFSTVTDGMKMMQNAFLQKKMNEQAARYGEPIDDQLLQLYSHDGGETETKAMVDEAKTLKDIFQTKIVVMGVIWSVADWTIFIIVIAIILVAALVFLIFCCCLGGDKKPEEPKMEEKKEDEKMEEEKMMMEPEMMAAE